MSDRDLVAALRAGDRLAAGQVYDVYGTRLFAYCHELLADAKLAADALRDTFIVAADRVRELNDPEEFGAWLYALARAECVRVGISEDAPADAAGAVRGDRLARIALDCYSMLEPGRRELLDLAFRHRLVDFDLALVLGVSESAVGGRVAEAQGELETALLTVLAARTGDPRCEDSADLGRRFDEIDGTGVSAWLQASAKHVEQCPICGDAVRNRRPLRLFEELPHAFMPPGVRSRVLEALRDPGGRAFAEQIVERAGRFDERGFPIGWRDGGPSRLRKWILPSAALSVVVAAAVLFMVITSGGPSSNADSATTSNTPGTSAVAPVSSASSFDELTGAPSAAGATGRASAGVTPSARQSTSQAVPQPGTPSTQHSCRSVGTSVPVPINTTVPVTVTYTVRPTPTSSDDSPTPYPTTSVSEKATTIVSQSPTTVMSCN